MRIAKLNFGASAEAIRAALTSFDIILIERDRVTTAYMLSQHAVVADLGEFIEDDVLAECGLIGYGFRLRLEHTRDLLEEAFRAQEQV